ncbi:PAS domain S-box protein [Inhella gelatinilytica]|uniref:Virulence sensor protein BvgS n=1 Tax=Inhella gelatinilytica TaxID=2795030 RepID=A0A931IV56_9BURK|nr:PAS domain S-box protein [Inhella gelatinilytica]MBH9553357.1 PAS domain S-box protein [Inhella gelatinilytica]
MLVALAMLAAGWDVVSHRREDLASELRTVTRFKSLQLADWLGERQADMNNFRTSALLIREYSAAQAGSAEALQSLERRLAQIREAAGYSGFDMVGSDGRGVGAPGGDGSIAQEPTLLNRLRGGAVAQPAELIGPYRDAQGRQRVAFVAPVIAEGSDALWVVLRVDPAHWLRNAVERWPLDGQAGECRLVWAMPQGAALLASTAETAGQAAPGLEGQGTELAAADWAILRERVGQVVPTELGSGQRFLTLVERVGATDWYLLSRFEPNELMVRAAPTLGQIGLVGVLAALLIVTLHVLHRQRQQRALAVNWRREHEQRLQALNLLADISRNSEDIIFAKDLRGRYLWMNPAGAALVHLEPEQILGRTDEEIHAGSFSEEFRAQDEVVVRELKPRRWETRLPMPGGGLKTYSVLKGPLRDQDGQLMGIFGIARDVSETKAHEEALRDGENCLRLALRGGDLGFWDWRPSQGTLSVNERWKTMLGLPADAPIVNIEDWMERIHPDDRARMDGLRDKSFSREGPDDFSVEVRARHASGAWVSVLSNGSVVERGEYGQAMRVVGTHQDVSARKLILRELQQERIRLERILEGTNVGTWEWEVQTGRVMFNERWAQIVGYALHELQPLSIGTWRELCHPEDYVRSTKLLEAHFRGETPGYECEIRMRHKEGRWVWVLDRGKVFSRDPEGQPLLMAGTHADITAKKQAEMDLMRLSLALAQSPASIIITDLDGTIEYVNEAFTRVSGYTAAEALGQTPRLLASGRTPPETYLNLWGVLTKGATWRGELVNRRKDGSIYTDLASIHPLRQADGLVTHYVSVQEDISEKRAMREELAQYRHHLEELVLQRTAELHEAKLQAEVASQSKSAFLANMSHEIRTPMNAILGLTQLIETDLTAAPAPEACSPILQKVQDRARKIEQSAHHLLGILNDVLDLSKIEAGKLRLDVTDFDLHELVQSVVFMVQDKAQTNRNRVRTELALAPRHMRGDGLRLGQILLNFLSNAVKFTEGGEVLLRARTVSVGDEPLRIRFEVRDSGIGLTAEQCARLFNPFEQAESSTTRQFGGTGLGLAIVRRLADLMEGQVGVQSRPGGGSTFWFEAPFLEAQRPASAETALPEPTANTEVLAQLRQRRAYVLLVEDTPINQEIALEMLRNAGVAADVAVNGRRAVHMAAERRYDLILMDLRMPIMDGFEATMAIRNIDQHVRTPIVAMTANAFAEDRAAALESGMNDHIGKPVSAEVLYETLLKWLPTRERPPMTPSPDAQRDTAEDVRGDQSKSETRVVPAGKSAESLEDRLQRDLAVIPGLDLRQGLAVLGGKIGVLSRLLRRFAADYAGAADRLAQAVESQDWEGSRRLAHTLRGASASLGLNEISRQAALVEEHLRQQQTPPQLEPLRVSLEISCSALSALDIGA